MMEPKFVSLRPAAMKHADLREQLKEAFGLADDDQALIDTLEGASDFADLCAAALREAKAREAMAEGLKALIFDMQTRKARMEHAAERIRVLVADAMLEAGERKLALPDMTVSVRLGKPKLAIDPDRIPDRFKIPTTTFRPNREAIQEAVDHGDLPEGVTISNPQPVIAIRGK
jgi:hypothetical protein